MSPTVRRGLLSRTVSLLLCAAFPTLALADIPLGLESPQQGVTLQTYEDGLPLLYVFRLNGAPDPGETVSVSFSSSDVTEGTVSSAPIVFDETNWQEFQSAQINPGASGDGNDGDVAYRITATLTSSGGRFTGAANARLDVVNGNVEGISRIVTRQQNSTAVDQFIVLEDDGVISGAATFRVSTTSTPSSEIVIPVSTPNAGEIAVFPSELRLNAGNSFSADITVVGLLDQTIDPDIIPASIVLGISSSGDPSYDGVSTPAIHGLLLDVNDQLSGNLEGLAAGNSVQVRVNYAPFDPCATSTQAVACKVTEAGSETLTLNANGSFGFTPIFNVFDTISVEVVAPPTGPVSQTCETSQTGMNGSLLRAFLEPIAVTCTAVEYTVGGQVSGLAGTGLVLQNNAGDNLSISSNGAFTFPTALSDGSRYDVTVLSNPSDLSQTCSVGRIVPGKGEINPGSGIISGANVNDIAITCTTNRFTIGGQVSGLVGSGLVLRNNGGDDLPVSANGGFTFATSLLDGSPYNVSVAVQPSNPAQTCSVPMAASPQKGVVVLGAGIVNGANITNIPVSCVTDPTAPGAPTNVQVQVNGSQTTVTWTPPANDGGSPITGYTVTLSPGGRTCTVTGNPPPTQCVFDNLTPGSYTANVIASNAVGGGAPGTGSGSNQVAPAIIPAGSPASLALLIALFGLLGGIAVIRRQH